MSRRSPSGGVCGRASSGDGSTPRAAAENGSYRCATVSAFELVAEFVPLAEWGLEELTLREEFVEMTARLRRGHGALVAQKRPAEVCWTGRDG